MDGPLDDGLRNIHAASDSLVVGWFHSIVLGQLINLDLSCNAWSVRTLESHIGWWLYLSKFSNISDLLSLQRAEVRRDSTALEIYDPGKWLVKQRSD